MKKILFILTFFISTISSAQLNGSFGNWDTTFTHIYASEMDTMHHVLNPKGGTPTHWKPWYGYGICQTTDSYDNNSRCDNFQGVYSSINKFDTRGRLKHKYALKSPYKINYLESKIIYDMNNNPISEGNVLNIKHKYLYDTRNNWVKRLTFENGKLKCIAERDIQYY